MRSSGGSRTLTLRPLSIRVGFAVAGALAFTAHAQAIEIVEQDVTKDQQGAAANWVGFYFSRQAGGSWAANGFGGARGDLAPPLMADETPGGGAKGPGSLDGGVMNQGVLGLMGVLGGARAGYNWGQGQVVYGVESELSYGEKVNHLAIIRGRLGVASDNWLFYGSAGAGVLANARAPVAPEAEGPALKLDIGENRAGFVVGGGIEAKLGPKLSVGVEGLYYGLDAGAHAEKFGPASAGAENPSDAAIVRGRLTLRLGNESEPLK